MPKPDKSNTRTETVGVRLDPRIHYLAGLAAREKERTLSSFIEWAVRRALNPEAIREPEAEPGRMSPPLYNEGLWDVDEADRFFKLATNRPDLLTIPEQRLWKLFCLNNPRGHYSSEVYVQAFRDFWCSPYIDTQHIAQKDGE